CAQWNCVDAYSWKVSGSSGTTCFSAELAGTVPPLTGSSHTTNAIVQIYTPASAGTTPLIASGTYDRYLWTMNTAQCAKIGGVWPLPQTVTPGGTYSLDTAGSITKRMHRTVTEVSHRKGNALDYL